MSRSRHLALLLVTLSLPAMTVPAEARTWLERFFSGEMHDTRRPQEVERPAPKVKPKVIKKVAAPSYFRYVAAQPVAVDFGAVMNAPVAAAGMVLGGGADFVSARAYLDGYELAAEKADAATLTAWYAEHQGFLWVTGFGPNAKAKAAVERLSLAGEEGLDAADYAVALPQDGFSMDKMPERLSELVRFEMALSARYLRYMRDMTSGRIDPNKLSGYHDLPVRPFDAAKALAALSGTADVVALMADAGPHAKEYATLKAELAALRQAAEDDIIVDSKLLLKPGGENPELAKLLALIKRDATPQLLAEHGAVIDALEGATTYSDEAVALIKAVQKEKGLNPDGVIGPRTVAALSPVSKAERLDKVTFAMERMRWLPHDLGQRRVFINQPEFFVRYYENDVETLSMRVVVGKKSNQTSFFYDEIEQVDFNPYWGVPQSIIVNEMLPRLQRDPGYLDRAGYEVTDAKGRRIPSSSIDWSAHGGKVPYNVRQTPGEANALGELKILFPNKHAIYMHDTPSKSLFNRDMRAFSHGCVRLHDPRAMAAAVLGTSVDAVKAQLAKGHSSTKVPVKIPVYVAYFTAWPGKDGAVGYFGDVYDRDDHLKKALKSVRDARQPVG
ncbi:MAG: L,D-transpeptidase family protein [Notoacmeibacter sp.]|nr:L,D-transpeptidase family protein [Notoacmeibacter sp.]